ncbi:Transition state regulatory protein AbrB [Lentibacillus sp. JNUCC-1]|uniref:AbrB/MazE/SpoVT family DNA-binding domain-containing protein n=1 Tax=Lentibacillus sp. JNUCC-1 TaxID=2654513 RepID=UPI0012E71BB3|nr:AbrB/MazE/SpoVT family DNA-binding domain-containing protein [Lentibacillus sp. JNUCC-1]MUV38008.1 Transition state regulatory protein AbrB [Lentibacillus sp. JNUCC-1]
MKSTGITRKLDELGRIVIPKELRTSQGIASGDTMEIYVDGDHIILKKYEPKLASHISGEVSEDNLRLADGKLVLSRSEARKIAQDINEYFGESN